MFIQVVQAKTTDPEGVLRQTERWDTDVRPSAKGYLGSTGGVADDGTVVFLARFQDEASAQANSDLPEQTAWWNEMEKYLTDVTFRNTSDTEEMLGGGDDKAGFVQIMQGHCKNRARLEELNKQFQSELQKARPDVLGGVTAWFGDDYVDAIYFASEAEARKGEQNMPDEVGGASFEEFMSLTENVSYIDLKNPILRSA
jgi:hypothetical protein